MDDDNTRILATAAAGVLVRAMDAPAWSTERDRWALVLGRDDKHRNQVAGRLEESATGVRAAVHPDRECVEQDVEAQWRKTIRAFLQVEPGRSGAVCSMLGGSAAGPPDLLDAAD